MSTELSQGKHGDIPKMTFSTKAVERRQQLDIWREFHAELIESDALAEDKTRFDGTVEVFNLGEIQFNRYTQAPAEFSRTSGHLRTSDMDHWVFSVVRKGQIDLSAGDKTVAAKPGSLTLLSFAQAYSGRMAQTEYSNIFLARDDFWDIAQNLDHASFKTFDGPMASILSAFIVSVDNQIDKLNVADGKSVNDAFAALLKAVMRPDPDSLEAADTAIGGTQLELARRFINSNLQSPDLSADRICSELHMSRRRLYYLFEQYGGVSKYIKTRRLAACYKALVVLSGDVHIGTVAYNWGFNNLPSFYRQFKEQYGFRPSEARSAHLSGYKADDGDLQTLADWLAR
ncbi:helix-turn-helix domain-containing protein [Agrobacterium sp. B1(2019)]|uniref:helix-turn-helix domain-containing protein n=1 Tax=Agrobacterium sp. B1(2019) TaxID=2607032 RepID=UPI0011EF5A0C|nr:helix-turn-helix domain-containing protein [Agrobacterium sp. B1(2019)]TZG32193.1 helix-turn-helix domain-containing protein [Agrobacterium sp. B1(2019)]